MHSFGSVIKEIRKNRKLTQKALSENICSQSVLSRIENDEELPNVVVMQQICQRLGVTIDYIMHLHSEDAHLISNAFKKLAEYFIHQDYKQLLSYLQRNKLEDRIYLDSDWQKYYYYMGSCEYYVQQNYEQALFYLQQGLSYSSHINKITMSDIEIRLMSCTGSTLSQIGQIKEAEERLKASIYYFHQLPDERISVGLTKIFFNYADFLLKQHRHEESREYVDQGITWARKKNSYYYLSELFELKGYLLHEAKDLEQAKEFQNLALKIRQIEKIMI